jgi:pimeloyl-ACP methyl ester carboxylesterase
MPIQAINGIGLFYELSGSGETPLVLVHGSWDSHHDWDLILPYLTQDFRILAYDRRGHSQSQRPEGQGSIREDVVDLAALIEQLELAPAWVVGNSFGGSITLRLAGERPELFRGLVVHEPPLFALLADDARFAAMMGQISNLIAGVAERIAAGDHKGAAEQFVETVALGAGMWAQLPSESQQTLIDNAPTFLDECRDPEQLIFNLNRIRGFAQPILLTRGGQSPPIFAPVLDKLSRVLSPAIVLPDAGHIPHVTHPEAYSQVIKTFVSRKGG